MPVSDNVVLTLVRRIALPFPSSPRIIGVDNWAQRTVMPAHIDPCPWFGTRAVRRRAAPPFAFYHRDVKKET